MARLWPDCGPTAPHCAPDGACHDDSAGDSGRGDAHAELAAFCGPAAMCQAGVEGDPCDFAPQGAGAAPFCAPDGMAGVVMAGAVCADAVCP